MAEDSGQSKSYAPTQGRLKKAREEGNALYVTQVNAVVLVIVFFILSFFIIQEFYSLYFTAYQKINYQIILATPIINLTTAILFSLIPPLFGILAALGILSLITSVIQLQGFRIVPFEIKFESFDIIKNAKEKFSGKNFIKLFLDVGFITIFLTIGALICIGNLHNITNSIYLYFHSQTYFLQYLFLRLLFLTCVSLLVFIIIVYAVEKHHYISNLKMTYEEIKKELEDNEGKSEVKKRIQEIRQEFMEDDSNAEKIFENLGSFLITNPTHYAILISYTTSTLPIVILKGKNMDAKKLIAIAKKVNLPIIEDKWLARQLYSLTKIGDFIPKVLIRDIGQVIGTNLTLIKPFIREKIVFDI